MIDTNALPLAADPAVPQRDQLMDIDAIARLLSRRLGRHGSVEVRSCRLDWINYRPGRRLRVVYRVGIDGRDLRVAAGTFRSPSRGQRAYRKAMDSAGGSGSVLPVAYDAGLETVFWTFPNDRRIENLSAVADAEEDLGRLLGSRWVRSRLVDYQPEVSAVVGCLDESSRVIAYAKVHAGDEAEGVHRTQDALARVAQGPRLRVARPLAYSKRRRTLLVEPIVGTSIGRLTGAGLLAGLHAYGAALANLHSLPTAGITTDGRDSLARLRNRADGVCLVRPDLGEEVAELLRELSARWDETKDLPVPIHGDANENNAILQGDRIALIDFERACNGAAGSDIGYFLGLLRYFRSLGVISPETERARAAAFLGGYSSVRSLPRRESLRVHESASLAARAFRPVTRLRRHAISHIPALLAEARGLLR